MRFSKLHIGGGEVLEGDFTIERVEATDRKPHEQVGPRASMPVDHVLMFVGQRRTGPTGEVDDEGGTFYAYQRVAVPVGAVRYAEPIEEVETPFTEARRLVAEMQEQAAAR